jgi:nucleoside-diphosphate-sugar epimerase
LFVSSLAAAGPAVAGRPLTEQDPPQPVSDYGRSKLAAEQDLLRMADQLPIQVVRPPSVFGDSDRYMLPLFRLAKTGFVILAGDAVPGYSFIHVDDLARALLHVSQCHNVYLRARCNAADHPDPPDKPNPGLVYLAQDPPMSFVDVATVISDTVGGGKLRTIHIPASLCWSLAAVNSLGAKALGLRPLLNVDKMREAMAGGWICNPHRLIDELGFDFPQTLEERIRETALSYQRQGWECTSRFAEETKSSRHAPP